MIFAVFSAGVICQSIHHRFPHGVLCDLIGQHKAHPKRDATWRLMRAVASMSAIGEAMMRPYVMDVSNAGQPSNNSSRTIPITPSSAVETADG